MAVDILSIAAIVRLRHDALPVMKSDYFELCVLVVRKYIARPPLLFSVQAKNKNNNLFRKEQGNMCVYVRVCSERERQRFGEQQTKERANCITETRKREYILKKACTHIGTQQSTDKRQKRR
jgi:hypothetical protein